MVSLDLRLAIAAHYSEHARSQWFAKATVEWDVIVEEAISSRLAPLLFHSLKKFPRQDIPEHLIFRLREIYLATATRNMHMLHQTKRVTSLLDTIGVPYILLKGAALIQDIYEGNVALRPMSDIDILVDSAEFPYARSEFVKAIEIGFSKLETEHISHHLRIFPAKNVCVELHSRIIGYEFYKNKPAFAKLWVGRDATRSGLSAEHQFVHLCAHNYLHHDDTISHFGADAAFVSQQVQDWREVAEFAAENDMLLPVLQGAAYLEESWFASIDVPTIEKILPSRREHIFAYCLRNPRLKLLARWLYVDSISSKLHYAWRHIVPRKHEFT